MPLIGNINHKLASKMITNKIWKAVFLFFAYMRGFLTAIIEECVGDINAERYNGFKMITSNLFDFIKLDDFLST
ncbi:unnamed protein product [Oikopleura dioica]|uniref:Uncharacterized protein n=1 Tax=Oikopleura dioica TaxID=34765 RepID=E4XYS1_OIKDI|nr:unnamed protein product [Oikopleura dioica]